MKLRVKKLPKEKYCAATYVLQSAPIAFGRTKLQVVVENNCGSWRATLGSPVRSRYLGAIRRYRRHHSLRFRTVHIVGYGKTKAAALADLDKAVQRDIKIHKALETWIEEHPIKETK